MIPALANRVFSDLPWSAFDGCDLIVQCGTPVLWENCHRCEWAIPLWGRVVGRLAGPVPVLNLAAGSCYPWERQAEEIQIPADAEYLRTILGYCRLTTVRDHLAQKLCRSLGTETSLLPCSAFLAADQAAPAKPEGNYLLINYMEGGGHYDWGQGIDAAAWKREVLTLMARLRPRYELRFICHNEAEYRLAQDLDPVIPRLCPKTPAEFFTLVAGAQGAVCNRLHASVALAGLGVPSVAVGTDTRMLMLKEIGLPFFYVKDANAENLEATLEELLGRRRQERERLLELRRKTLLAYRGIVADALGVVGSRGAVSEVNA